MALHGAINAGHVRACHDLSEGGLAVAAAEMAFAGGLGLDLDLGLMSETELSTTEKLFAESNSRFLVEVDARYESAFVNHFQSLPCVRIGTVVASADTPRFTLRDNQHTLFNADITHLKRIWQSPLDW